MASNRSFAHIWDCGCNRVRAGLDSWRVNCHQQLEQRRRPVAQRSSGVRCCQSAVGRWATGRQAESSRISRSGNVACMTGQASKALCCADKKAGSEHGKPRVIALGFFGALQQGLYHPVLCENRFSGAAVPAGPSVPAGPQRFLPSLDRARVLCVPTLPVCAPVHPRKRASRAYG